MHFQLLNGEGTALQFSDVTGTEFESRYREYISDPRSQAIRQRDLAYVLENLHL